MNARRFLNAMRSNSGCYSLGRIKVKNNLFYASTAEALQQQAMAAATAAKKENKDTAAETLEKDRYDVLSLSRPRFEFKPSSRHSRTDLWFLPFYGVHGEGNFLCVDEAGHAALYDADADTTEMMPRLRTPKRFLGPPMSCSVTHGDAHDPNRPDALYVMDKADGSFEALVYGDPKPPSDRMFMSSDRHAWHWRSLPLPPVDDADPSFTKCYALLHGQDDTSSTIMLSFTRWDPDESLLPGGTYCFDTASHEWTKAGDWALPFWGRSHHAPELGDGLLFGLEGEGSESRRFCAVDISGTKMNGAPVLRHAWLEHAEPPPEHWRLDSDSVEYLGAGRFCIHRTFDIMAECGYGDWDSVGTVVLLTGVEVVRAPGSSRLLRMVKHKTKRLDYGISSVF